MLPILPVRPVNTHISAPANNSPHSRAAPSPTPASRTIPSAVTSFDPNDPRSIEAVSKIVESVLKEMNITVNRAIKPQARSKKAKSAQAIREQKGKMSPEDDCRWKVNLALLVLNDIKF